jgi:hypothetical protein
VTDHAKELIEKHANEYLDAEEAAQKRDKEGLKSALDKHEELKQKAEQTKTGPKATASESDFDSTDNETENPVAEKEPMEDT